LPVHWLWYRYLKTFPEGGHWKGYNYLFDKRKAQKPALKGEVLSL
jgi:predicted sulfurtransferase